MFGAQNMPTLPRNRGGGGGGGFFNDITGGLSSRLGGWIGDKVFGIPSPKTGSAAGLEQREYMESAFPGSSTLDRLGISQASQGVNVAKQQRANKKSEMGMMATMQDKQLENNKEVARIQTGSKEGIAGRELTLKKRAHEEIHKPISSAQLRQYKQELSNLSGSEKLIIQKLNQAMTDWSISKERLTIEQVKAKYAELIAASGIAGKALTVASGIIGFGAMIIGVKNLAQKLGTKIGKAIAGRVSRKATGIAAPATRGRRIRSSAPNKIMRVRIPKKTFGNRTNKKFLDEKTKKSRAYWQDVMKGKKN